MYSVLYSILYSVLRSVVRSVVSSVVSTQLLINPYIYPNHVSNLRVSSSQLASEKLASEKLASISRVRNSRARNSRVRNSRATREWETHELLTSERLASDSQALHIQLTTASQIIKFFFLGGAVTSCPSRGSAGTRTQHFPPSSPMPVPPGIISTMKCCPIHALNSLGALYHSIHSSIQLTIQGLT